MLNVHDEATCGHSSCTRLSCDTEVERFNVRFRLVHFCRHCHYLNSILYIKHFKVHILLSFVRSPEPQQPQPKATDDIIRSDNNDPDEDEDYYRKQLSYFDRRSFDSKPSAQLAPAIKPTQPQTKPGYYPRYVFKYLIILNATLFNVFVSPGFDKMCIFAFR